MEPITTPDSVQNTPSVEIARQVLDEARQLVLIEVELARQEARDELGRMRKAATAGALALSLVLMAFSALVSALILALGATAVSALIVAGVLLLLGTLGAVLAYRVVPKSPLDRTRKRLKDDISRLREHTA